MELRGFSFGNSRVKYPHQVTWVIRFFVDLMVLKFLHPFHSSFQDSHSNNKGLLQGVFSSPCICVDANIPLVHWELCFITKHEVKSCRGMNRDITCIHRIHLLKCDSHCVGCCGLVPLEPLLLKLHFLPLWSHEDMFPSPRYT